MSQALDESKDLPSREEPDEVGFTEEDEAFFFTTEEEEYFAAQFDQEIDDAFDEDPVPLEPPPPVRRVALLLTALSLVGVGASLYAYSASPYVGEGLVELQVDRGVMEQLQRAARPERDVVAAAAVTAAPAPAPAAPVSPAPQAPPAPVETAAPEPEPAAQPAPEPAAQPEPAATDSAAYANLLAEARGQLAKRHKRQAYKLFAKAAKANAGGWEAWQAMALINMERGKMRHGHALAQKALSANPQAPYAHLVVGTFLDERGKLGQARKAWATFIKLCPRCRYARDVRNSLR